MRRGWLVPLIGIIVTILIATTSWCVWGGPSAPSPQPNRTLAFAPAVPTDPCQFNGTQVVDLTNLTGSSWQIQLDTFTSTALSPTATASTVEAALNADTPIAGWVGVTGASGGPYVVQFIGPVTHTVDMMTATNGVAVELWSHDQTAQLQRMINQQPSNSTLTLPRNSCWEIDGGVAPITSGLSQGITIGTLTTPITIGTLTTAISAGAAPTFISVTTSGTSDVPPGSTITIANGNTTQDFTTLGSGANSDTPPNSTSIYLAPGQNVTTSFPITTTTVTPKKVITQLFVNTSGNYVIPVGTVVQVSNASGSNTQNFKTVVGPDNSGNTPPGSTPVKSTVIDINAATANNSYNTSSTATPQNVMTSISVHTSGFNDIPTGTTILIAQGSNTQTFTTLGDTPPGNPTIPIRTTTPAQAFNQGQASIYALYNPLQISGNTGVTVNGNGANLVQTVCQLNDSDGAQPFFNLESDTGLTLENMNLFGGVHTINGCSGGDDVEGDAGIIAHDETNLTLNNFNIYGIQGDVIDLYQTYTGPNKNAMNTNVIIENSTFNESGYRGLVPEAVGPTLACEEANNFVNQAGVCGAKIINDNWYNIALTPMDWEVDAGSTTFDSNGYPTYAAQDNILIQNNVYKGWFSDWFAELQGSQGGIQSQYNSFINNKLYPANATGGNGAFMQIGVAAPNGGSTDQVIFSGNPTGGTFKLSIFGVPTSLLTYDPVLLTAATIKTALDASLLTACTNNGGFDCQSLNPKVPYTSSVTGPAGGPFHVNYSAGALTSPPNTIVAAQHLTGNPGTNPQIVINSPLAPNMWTSNYLFQGNDVFPKTGASNWLSDFAGSGSGAGQIIGLANSVFQDNNFYVAFFEGSPSEYFMSTAQTVNVKFMNNNVQGSLGVIKSSSRDLGLVDCGNTYSYNPTVTEPPCP